MPRRLGVMGGTFDPVHIGHLRIAEEAAEALALETVLFIPSATPPHKPDARILPFEHRIQMLKESIDGNPRFRVSDLEMRLPGKSYTVNTLRKLPEEWPGEPEIFFLVGMDAFLELDTWWRYRELFELARMVVLSRGGYGEEMIGSFIERKVSELYVQSDAGDVFRHPTLLPVYILRNTRIGVSSTRIRELVAQGRSIRYLVLPEVLSYIDANGLYRQGDRKI